MSQHDEVAVPMVMECWRRFGYQEHRIGQEADAEELRKLLLRQSDPTSLLLRFRPDRVFVHPNVGSILCEIKSDPHGHANFAIEVDSYLSARMWNAGGFRHVCFAFVDLQTRMMFGCFADEVRAPPEVLVPNRPGHANTLHRLSRELPHARQRVVPWRQGSGTAFFIISKHHPMLLPLEQFIRYCVMPDDERAK